MKSLDQRRMPLFEALTRYAALNTAYFRIPGHRGAKGINAAFKSYTGDAVFGLDRTETPLLDDLHAPKEAIKEAQELAANLFGADRTWFCVNGTSAANQAMMLACASPGESIIIPRNAHRSVLSGLILGDIKPVYVRPSFMADWGIPAFVRGEDVEFALRENPEAKAVLIVSPTYHGIVSDIKGIADICNNAGVPLLVDEAHGAHCYFSDQLPAGALAAGADACGQSTHKVLGALTQASMVHLRGGLVSEKRLSSALKILQSTSPSYLLLASLDCARQDMALKGGEWTARAIELAAILCREIEKIKGLRVLKGADIDPTRITIDVSALRFTGFEVKRRLFENYGVDLELADLRNVTAVVTGGNTKEDIEKLINALVDLAAKAVSSDGAGPAEIPGLLAAACEPPQPPAALSPREAFFADTHIVSWKDVWGKTSAETIALYPPGIPVVYPGEVITPKVWDYIETNRKAGCRIQGPVDSALSILSVVRE